jgi:hypothetical protein
MLMAGWEQLLGRLLVVLQNRHLEAAATRMHHTGLLCALFECSEASAKSLTTLLITSEVQHICSGGQLRVRGYCCE